ncbi:MAG TPA: type II toxin-antitoxin system prevent-host-death family antitoxin [Ideonella sp.]|nr:type II toxin-antitoxin system prevent-host-death family antitoxin [Ideonella sp.]
MAQYNIAQAKAQFSELVQRALAGEEVVIARDNRPLLRLSPLASAGRGARQPGSAKGLIKSMAADFDAPLDDFADHS